MDVKLKEALDACNIMALGTEGADGSWVSPVKYSYSDSGELYFVSYPTTKHAQNISADPRVSAAIYAYPQGDGGALGLQIKGEAVDKDVSTDKDGWHQFVVTPSEIWLIDTREGRRERERIL